MLELQLFFQQLQQVIRNEKDILNVQFFMTMNQRLNTDLKIQNKLWLYCWK